MVKNQLVKIVSSFALGIAVAGSLDSVQGFSYAGEPKPAAEQSVAEQESSFDPLAELLGYELKRESKSATGQEFENGSKSFFDPLAELLGEQLRNREGLLKFCREIENDEKKSTNELLGIYSNPSNYFDEDKCFEKWDIRNLSEETKKAYENFAIKIDFEKDPSEYDNIDKGNRVFLYALEEKDLAIKIGLGFRRMLGIESSPAVLKERERFLEELKKPKKQKHPYWSFYSDPDSFFKGYKDFEEWDIRKLPEEKRRLYEVDLCKRVMGSDLLDETKKFYENTLMNIDFEKDPFKYDNIDKGNKILLYSQEKVLPFLKGFNFRIKLPPGECF